VTRSAGPSPSTPATQAPSGFVRGPLFGGYILVAVVVAWLVGIALRASDTLPPRAAPCTWLALSGACAMLATLAVLLAHGRIGALSLLLRVLLAAGVLGVFLALGAARAAWTDPGANPNTVARYANGAPIHLRGEVIAEPDLRDGARLLTIEVASVRVGDDQPERPASGRVTAAFYGPDDWFAPAYGDTLSLSGDLVPRGARATRHRASSPN
jgi:hypothetical protein